MAKPIAADLSVISIIGTGDVAVGERAPPGGGDAQLALVHSCSTTGPNGFQVADPAVRIGELAASFEGRGHVLSICDAYEPPMYAGLARLLKNPLGVVCLDSSRLTDSTTERGIQPACELTEINGTAETPLLDFTIAADPVACPETADHLRLVVNRTDTPPAGAYIRARRDAVLNRDRALRTAVMTGRRCERVVTANRPGDVWCRVGAANRRGDACAP